MQCAMYLIKPWALIPKFKDNIVTPSRGLPPGLKISSNIFCGKILVSEAVMASLACKVARTLPAAPSRMLAVAVSFHYLGDLGFKS